MKDLGLDDVYMDAAPQSIKILVNNFHEMQKKVADVCLRVVEEIDRQNRASAKAKFTGIAELKKTIKIIAQSTSNAYKYRPGVLFNKLDLKIGSMYPGTECIQAMLQLNKKRIVQGRLDAERLLLQLGSLDNKDVLNLGMRAERFVQVFPIGVRKYAGKSF